MWYVLIKIWNKRMARDYYFTISPEGSSVEIMVRSSISPKFQIKMNFKWLPLNRDHFKFYFHKDESILIVSCHTYLLTRKFIILFQVIFVLPCIFVLVKISYNSMLLINNPLKRGDVKTLARSLISSSSQVKVKLKLTASR